MLSALGKVAWSPYSRMVLKNSSTRGYCSTSVVLARKGSSAFIEKPRDFSKKQKKRFKKRMFLKVENEKRNNSLGGAANDLISRQLELPETQELIETTGDSMLKDIREMMLPDGLQALLHQYEEGDELYLDHLGESASVPHLSEIGMKLSNEEILSSGGAGPGTGIGTDLSFDLVTEDQANAAMVLAASQGKKSFVNFMFDQTSRLGIPVENSTLASIIAQFSNLGQHEDVEYFFDKALACNMTPDSASWSAYIAAQCRSEGGHASGLQVLERVKRLGVDITAAAYTAVLADMVAQNKNDEAFEFWMRMKEDGVQANVSSYEAMMQHCVQTYQVERAFNYLDEMKGSKVDLNAAIFEKLFKCCGSAPHWVNGYQDIIFDAMALMEGAELVPTTGVYNSIIYSFGKAGDAAAAEFYFWEMREKGIEQTSTTYKNLFEAFASSQRVGASKYGVRPRYVRPPEKPKTELQRLMLKAGAVATSDILSSRFSSEGKLDRGKRQYAPLVSTEDDMDPEEAEEELREELRLKTLNQPNFHEQLLLRQKEQRSLRDSETGRRITLSLLTRGKAPEPGKIFHIAPGSVGDCHENLKALPSSNTYHSSGLSEETLDVNYDLRSDGPAVDIEKSFPSPNVFNNKAMVRDDLIVHNSLSNAIVDLLDNNGYEGALSSNSLSLADHLAHDIIPRDEIDKQWQVVLFGRCPDPDFSAPIKLRRSRNITCADSLYAEMLEQGIEPDSDILSAYMSVASEAMQWEKANEIVNIFKSKHNISPNAKTFQYFVRMHIFMSDISGCMERFQEMKNRGILPDRETYGMLVATLAHRDDLVRAVQVLEEADKHGIQISNRHIKKLRSRFNKLNIRHPNIFPDPNLWVKDVKKVRANKRNAPTGNKLQYLNSLTFL